MSEWPAAAPDGLDPPGEQLELPWDGDPPGQVVETVVHRISVHGYGSAFYWYCACGREGPPTTEGRANGGGRVHMRGVRRRITERA